MRDGDDAGPKVPHRVLQTVAAHVQPGSFPLLLAATAFNYALNGVAARSLLLAVGHLAVLGAGLYVLSESRVTVRIGLLLLATYVALASGLLSSAAPLDRLILDALASGYLVWVLGVVLRAVFRSGTSERDAVVGALAGFLLILSVFMRLHGLIESVIPGAYRVDGPPLGERSDAQLLALLQYFSTITLTSVGFGDVVPVTPLARLVTGLEAIIGQMYLAVVIATLVGRAAARRE
jgi:voltage-gated potassium channel Kch